MPSIAELQSRQLMSASKQSAAMSKGQESFKAVAQETWVTATDTDDGRTLADWMATVRDTAARVVVSVLDYGAVGGGVVDDTAAFEAAILALRAATVTVSGTQTGTTRAVATLFIPPGLYKITRSLDLQKINTAWWAIEGYGATIQFAATGKTLFDLLGSRFFSVRGLTVIGDATSKPAIAFQTGRYNAVGSGGSYTAGSHISFIDVRADGYWTRSIYYGLQEENELFVGCHWYNSDATGNAAALVIDGINSSSYGIVTDYPISGTAPTTNTVQSCTLHKFVGGTLYVASGTPVVAIDASHFHLDKVYIVTFDAVGVRLITSIGLLYDINIDVHTETSGAVDAVVIERTSNGTVLAYTLNIRDPIGQASNSLLKVGTNVTSLSVFGGELDQGVRFPAARAISGNAIWNGLINGVPVSRVTGGDVDRDLGAVSGVVQAWHCDTVTSLTAPRTYTLPGASKVMPGTPRRVSDSAGGVSPTNYLIIAPNGSDTINGFTSWTKHNKGGHVDFYSDGSSRWSAPPERGITRVTTNFTKTGDTTLADVPGLIFHAGAGKTYKFRAQLFANPDATGGSNAGIGGTATATTIRYDVNIFNQSSNALLSSNRISTMGSGLTGVGGTLHRIEIEGMIIVNAAGTFTVQFAQAASNGSTSVLVLSSFEIEEVLQ